MTQPALKAALSARLAQLQEQKKSLPRAAGEEAPREADAPAAAGPADTADDMPPKGAIPRLGFDNAGRPVSPAMKQQQAKALMERLPEDWVMIYRAPEEAHTITVLTDPTCPYCQRLHEAIPELNAAGITVRYLMYPRALSAGMNDPRALQLVNAMNAAWCAPDPKAAMDVLFAGGSAGRPCSALPEDDPRPRDPAVDHHTLGQVIGVTGTPYILHNSGRMWAGFSGTEDLIRRVRGS